MEDVQVIAQRYTDREKTDPNARMFTIADHIVVGDEGVRAGRMYVGDEFRAVVITIKPGQQQKLHVHPNTTHAWFVVSGSAEVTMEDGKKARIAPGIFSVQPRNCVHGIRNDTEENFTYIALSIGD